MRTRRRAGEIDRQIRIDLRDGFAQRRTQIFRRLSGVRAHHDGAELRRGLAHQQRHIEAGAVGLAIEWALHQRVGHDADDRAPRLRLRRIEMPHLVAERALLPQYFARETGVDDRDRLFRVAIVEGEIAALQNLQAEGVEIAVRDRFGVALAAGRDQSHSSDHRLRTGRSWRRSCGNDRSSPRSQRPGWREAQRTARLKKSAFRVVGRIIAFEQVPCGRCKRRSSS